MIPKVIHQIWSEIDGPLPKPFKILGDSWKENHPDWKYEYWEINRMIKFIKSEFPQYEEKFNSFPYNIQRWDAIRYLILLKIGGLYVDFDYECLEPFDGLLKEKKCHFSQEPVEHVLYGFTYKPYNFNNALMACEVGDPFMELIVDKVFSDEPIEYSVEERYMHILFSTGPHRLIKLYEEYAKKEDIYIIPKEIVTPFSIFEAKRVIAGERSDELEKKLEQAKAIHYFTATWV